ncbi:MAG: cysteine dioxygenase family protein [Armatimonadetes bacterium]|nr:cysteine dioxygenase family protein [Armatimonadota bacterium]
MSIAPTPSKLEEMIRMLDQAVKGSGETGCCLRVKEVLEHIVATGESFLDPHFLEPVPGRYARRLVHKDPDGAYTVLAMVWGEGQGTPLHDHAGKWCCEIVYQGRIKVVQYDLTTDIEAPVLTFDQQGTIYAGVGEAGALIPPFEYHSIENATENGAAVTIHVYAGELTWCHTFHPVDGGFRMERRELCYTD